MKNYTCHETNKENNGKANERAQKLQYPNKKEQARKGRDNTKVNYNLIVMHLYFETSINTQLIIIIQLIHFRIFFNFHNALIVSVLLKILALVWALCQTTLWSFCAKRIDKFSFQIESHLKKSTKK